MATRRGFLSGMLSAAAAGPAAAKSALGSLSSAMPPTTPYPQQGMVAGSMCIGGGDYRASLLTRIASMRKMTREEKRRQYGLYREEADRASVLSLRSVSDRHKAQMIYEKQIERNHERDLFYALRDLAGMEVE